jgi:hypothetical protein
MSENTGCAGIIQDQLISNKQHERHAEFFDAEEVVIHIATPGI